jgi:hypothetical protein
MRYLTALTLTLVGMSAAGAGDIYCINGGRDCSDRPSPGATVVHVTGTQSADGSLGAPTPAAEKPAGSVDAAANARLSQNASRQAVQKDVSGARAEQCKQAQEKYQKSVEARRVYRMGKDGEREYLSDNDAEQMRLNLRLEVEQACGKNSG